MVTSKVWNFDAIHYPFNSKTALRVISGETDEEDAVEYIRRHGIKEVKVVMPDLEFLNRCPELLCLDVSPSFDALHPFSFAPVYGQKNLKMLHTCTRYGEKNQYIAEFDYSQLPQLEYLIFEANKGAKGFESLKKLKTLAVGGYASSDGDLKGLYASKELDTLELKGCKEVSLEGIDISLRLQYLSISYNRRLKDISALKKVKTSLKALNVYYCPAIEDYSVLGELENLELLRLIGNFSVENLSFISRMKNLKTFVFGGNVLDGDLSACLDLEYVYFEKYRRHYNLKDSDFSKKRFVRGNEDIEEWRRLE